MKKIPLRYLLWLPLVCAGVFALVLLPFSKQWHDDARSSQQASLQVAAETVAVLLEQESIAALPKQSRGVLYPVSPLHGEITLDGRRDEWPVGEPLALSIDHLLEIRFPYKPSDLTAQLSLASDQDWLYLHVEVLDDFVVYRRINGLSVHRNDHLQIAYLDSLNRFWRMTIAALQPGEIVAMEVSPTGRALRTVDEVSGRWMATERGYNIEFRLPRDAINGRFSALVVDVDDEASREIKFMMGLSHTHSEESLGQILFSPTPLEQLLGKLPYAIRLTADGVPDILSGGFNEIHDPVEAAATLKGGSMTMTLRQSPRASEILSGVITERVFLLVVIVLLSMAIATAIAGWLFKRRIESGGQQMLSLLQHRGGGQQTEAAPVRDVVGGLEAQLSAAMLRLNQHNEYLERMASRLNHELRTPVSVVKSSIENLQSEVLPERAGVYVDRASLGIGRLNNILNKMSEARRLEEALDEEEMVRFDLTALVAGCVAGYESAYEGISFDLVIESEELPVTGIPELMAQLLDKLVDNAVGFSTADEVKVRLSAEENMAFIRVMNEGPKLPDMQGENTLFDSMTSLRQDESGSHLGLGLYIARVIADFHGATLTIADREDVQGVTVTLCVPILRLTSKLR